MKKETTWRKFISALIGRREVHINSKPEERNEKEMDEECARKT